MMMMKISITQQLSSSFIIFVYERLVGLTRMNESATKADHRFRSEDHGPTGSWTESYQKEKRPSRSTPFQKKVYDCVRRIPPGKVASYGTVKELSSCAERSVIRGETRLMMYRDIESSHQRSNRWFSRQWGKGQPNTDRKYALLRKKASTTMTKAVYTKNMF